MTYRENYDQPDEQFKVEADGTYIVEANIYTMKVAVSLVEGLYILGGATDTGWSLDDMAAFAKDGSKYTISCNLKAGEEFRFPLQKKSGVWWPCLMIAEDGESLVIGYDDSDKVAYKLTESGNYTVTVDLDTMKCNFSR
ncbi:MAG: SusF/SusE family outer membrane protein [Bacteroidales bacterium]|nr:SusF/SusE family outer membrane protein [Bacteroidales bacterium]